LNSLGKNPFKNEFQEKFVKRRIKRNKKMPGGSMQSQKINKIAAKKVNYDFYFYNNQNIFVVKS
jgi:hypothetical protein